MTDLATKNCVPCREGAVPLRGAAVTEFLKQLPGWEVLKEHHLTREFRFADFAQAMAFANRVGALAEEQGHHPDMQLSWGRVRVDTWTHKIDGLTESDFVLAAKISALVAS